MNARSLHCSTRRNDYNKKESLLLFGLLLHLLNVKPFRISVVSVYATIMMQNESHLVEDSA